MRLLSSTLLLAMVASGEGSAFGVQAPAVPAASQTSTPTASATPAVASTASAILQPALTDLQATLGSLHTEKWKGPVRLRDDADANIRSIRRDMDTVLPPLLTEADGTPDSVVSGLPVLRNVEALYDVLLRVAVTAKASAPAVQSGALEQALGKLDDARRTLGEHLQLTAVAREKQVTDLQAALRAVPPPAPAPVAVVAPTPVPVKKRTPRKRSASKPAPAAAAPATQ